MQRAPINARRNAWTNFRNKARDPVTIKIIDCLEELQEQINELRAELQKQKGRDDDGR